MKSAKALIRRGLARFGYELRRKPDQRRLERADPKRSAGRILEMVGPSGIGKSTLFNAVSQDLGRDWFLPRDAAELVLDRLDGASALEAVQRQLLFAKAQRLQRESFDFWVFAGRLRYGAQVAERDMLMRRPRVRGFALDEGLIQVFSQELMDLDDADWALALQQRALVVLLAEDSDVVAARALERHRKHLALGLFRHPTTRDALRRQAEKSAECIRRVAARAEASGNKVLHLRAEEAPAMNRDRLLAYAEMIMKDETV